MVYDPYHIIVDVPTNMLGYRHRLVWASVAPTRRRIRLPNQTGGSSNIVLPMTRCLLIIPLQEHGRGRLQQFKRGLLVVHHERDPTYRDCGPRNDWHLSRPQIPGANHRRHQSRSAHDTEENPITYGAAWKSINIAMAVVPDSLRVCMSVCAPDSLLPRYSTQENDSKSKHVRQMIEIIG